MIDCFWLVQGTQGFESHLIAKITRGYFVFDIIRLSVKEEAFLENRLFSSHSEHIKKLSKSSDWLEKSRLSKKSTFFLDI